MDLFKKIPPIFQLSLIAVIAGLNGVLVKIALESIPPFTTAFIRMLIIASFTFIVLKKLNIKPAAKNMKLFSRVSVFWILNMLLFAFGLEKTTATTAQFIHVSIPILSFIISAVFYKNKIMAFQVIGLIIGAIGVFLVILDNGNISFSNQQFLGNVFIFASAISFALYLTISHSKKYIHIRALEMIFISTLLGSIFSIPFMISDVLNTNLWQNASKLSLLAIIAAGFLSAIFYNMFQFMIKKLGSASSATLYLMPFFTFFWATILIGEKLTISTLIGGILTMIGVRIITKKT